MLVSKEVLVIFLSQNVPPPPQKIVYPPYYHDSIELLLSVIKEVFIHSYSYHFCIPFYPFLIFLCAIFNLFLRHLKSTEKNV